MTKSIPVWLLLAMVSILCCACAKTSQKPHTDPPSQQEQIVCTQDAMQCPDGGWVGRSGPNCAFACPNGGDTSQ